MSFSSCSGRETLRGEKRNMDVVGTSHMDSWAASAAVGIPLVFTASQFRVGAQSRRSIVLSLNCTSRHCRQVSTGQSDLLTFNSVTGQVGFGKRKFQIFEAQMIFTSNVVSKKKHILLQAKFLSTSSAITSNFVHVNTSGSIRSAAPVSPC